MTTLDCAICKTAIGDGERFVLVRGGQPDVHCSQVCLVANVERRRAARTVVWRRWLWRAAAAVLIFVGTDQLWHRIHPPRPRTISFEPPEIRPTRRPRTEAPMYGPAWPPTEEDWTAAFARVAWIYPLPGPVRRAPAADDRIPNGGSGAGRRTAVCRVSARCGVDLGGELWGEHVYAAQDGIVDHVQRGAGDDRGDVYVRLSHLGGTLFTHYAHLAAVPRRIVHGAAIKAGDVIGLVGDTGGEHPGRYLHFALSVRPSNELPEVYWDPTALMKEWPLQVPTHGTVAGFVPAEGDLVVPGSGRRAR
jgi:murein DD-endopeptidase MepM/ murein hydrolase activator NlpD